MKFVYASGSRPLDGYTIKRGIGVGGFGEVYFATSDAGKEVALKRIQRNLDVEVRGVSQCINLKHPNLLSLYDIKYDDFGEGWIVMEYIGGESLRDAMDDHPTGMPHDQLLSWFDGIMAGVAYLHDHGIVHRDLKPANIFSDEGVVKIGDYGLSKFISCSRRSGQTESVGTFHYMAPEIGRGVYGREIDVYALGIILYEMLTGNVPFEGESSQEIIMKHLTATPDLAGVPQPYREVIRRSLLKDPDQRFRSVSEMREALGPTKSPAGLQTVGARTVATGASASAVGANVGNSAPAREVVHIADDQAGIYLGPLRESAGTSPFHSGVPVVTASVVDAEEPIAKAVKDGCRNLSCWWRDSAMSAPVKVVVLIAVAALLVFNSTWLIPTAVALGLLYLCYFGIRSLVLASGGTAGASAGQPIPARANQTGGDRLPEQKEYRLRHWHQLARQAMQRKPAAMRASELSGSMLLSAIVAGVLCLVMFIVGGRRLDGNINAWIELTWLSVSCITGAWLVLTMGKFWEGSEGESIRRRFAMLVAGLGIGLMSFVACQYLTLETLASADLARQVSAHDMPSAMYAADGSPLLPAYLAYFGGMMVLLPWWKQVDPLRRTRFSLMSTGWCVLWAWILNMFLPFPQPWGVLAAATISVAVQLSAPWISGEQRTGFRHEFKRA